MNINYFRGKMLLYFSLFLISGILSPSKSGRIIGGNDARPHAFPFIASLKDVRFANSHYCAGSVLNENYILTTGNCCHKVDSHYIQIGVGEHHLYQTDHEQFFKVKKMIVHENYDKITLKNDICLLKADRNIKFNSYVSTTKLPNLGLAFENETGIISGWGSLSLDLSPSNMLQFLTVEIMSNELCSELYMEYYDPKTMMCAASKENSGFCLGDSGGPLICDDFYQCGMISWNIKCGKNNYPGVFTRLGDYVNWIQDNMEKKGHI
ncbi:trypsin V-B-like [Lepeophtheirus salmonis]|uniref:trypsin V-B-like n=1 Tax=Lepeophtheirus salmonis TaxID=72036 RepID=UPI003AF36FFC